MRFFSRLSYLSIGSFFQQLISSQGGEIHEEEKVLSIRPGDIVTVTTNKPATYQAKSIVITAGPWAKNMLKPIGLDLPLEVKHNNETNYLGHIINN